MPIGSGLCEPSMLDNVKIAKLFGLSLSHVVSWIICGT